MMHKKVIKFDSIKLEKFRNTDLSTNNYNEIIMYIVQLSKSYKFTFFSFDRQKFNNNKKILCRYRLYLHIRFH